MLVGRESGGHGTMAGMQKCSEGGCGHPAAFTTRSRPAWCDGHITAILRRGGLEPLEPFAKPSAYRLTRCLTCGCVAHYRLEYTLDRNAAGELTCRACFWRKWAHETRALQGDHADLRPVPEAEARQHAEANGYTYLEALTDPSPRDDPHRVRCRSCEHIRVARLGDIGFGCSCGVNPKRSRQTSNPPGGKSFLKDSEVAARSWWDHERNDGLLWQTATLQARRDAHWHCPECGLSFTQRIRDMVSAPTCPDCVLRRAAEARAEYERYCNTPVADVAELLTAWADDADPRGVPVAGAPRLRRFCCPQGHHPRVSPYSYLLAGCPVCRGLATRAEHRETAAADPDAHRLNPELAAQWHPAKNPPSLNQISPDSRRVVWWRDPHCGHEWQASPADREKGQRLRCPECSTILDSLVYHFPELAAEWSPVNSLNAWQVRPSGQTPFLPTWVCSTDPAHVWQATLASRTAGSSCPECREHGKSSIELEHHAAAVALFGRAASGQPVDCESPGRRSRWFVDITVGLPGGQKLAIEYDGSYWHADQANVDTQKSLDLLAAGYLVVRLREHPLPPLQVQHDRYVEFIAHSEAPDPEGAIRRIHDWATKRTTQDKRAL